MLENLKSKNTLSIELIAKYFISIDLDTKIKTITDLQNEIDVSRGTIQNSIKVLTEAKAVCLLSRGKLGTFLIEKNLDLLLEYSNLRFLVGVMPLPYSKHYEGLSTGLLYVLEQTLNLPVNMAYMRGSQKRIQLVLNGRYDYAIVSKFAALEYINHYPDELEIVSDFGKGSYLNEHVLLMGDHNKNEIEDGMRVGIDYDSIDQSKLTLLACKDKQVSLIQVDYSQLLEMLKRKEIDATVWNGDEISENNKDLNVVKLNIEQSDNTSAVIVIDRNRIDLRKVLIDAIDEQDVLDIQNDVIAGGRIPSY